MSGWIKKLDDFINRQGITSSELCVIIDEIEKEIQSLHEELNRERALSNSLIEGFEGVYGSDFWTSALGKYVDYSQYQRKIKPSEEE